MKEKKAACVDVCTHVCLCQAAKSDGVVLIYSLSLHGQLAPTWTHRAGDTLSFQNMNPRPSDVAMTHP